METELSYRVKRKRCSSAGSSELDGTEERRQKMTSGDASPAELPMGERARDPSGLATTCHFRISLHSCEQQIEWPFWTLGRSTERYVCMKKSLRGSSSLYLQAPFIRYTNVKVLLKWR